MKNLKTILAGIAIAAVTVVIVYAGSNFRKIGPVHGQEQKTDTLAFAGDSIEVVGTPTNDDPWKELEKIIANYYSKSGIAYTGMMKVIDDNGDEEKITEVQSFEYTLLNNNYTYRLGTMEVVNTKNCLLTVDHGDSTIRVSGYKTKSNKSSLFDIAAFKKIIVQQKADARVTQLGEDKILTIDNIKDPGVQGYRIYYSPRTYRIHKMLLGMVRAEPIEEPVSGEEAAGETGPYYYYLETTFTHIRELSLTEKDFHPEQKFITIHDKRIELTAAFKGYQLFNTIQP